MRTLALRLVAVLGRLELSVEFRLSSPEDGDVVTAYGMTASSLQLKFCKQARVPEGTVVIPGRALRAQIALELGLTILRVPRGVNDVGHRIENILRPHAQLIALGKGVADFGIDNDAPVKGIEITTTVILEATGLPSAKVTGPQHTRSKRPFGGCR